LQREQAPAQWAARPKPHQLAEAGGDLPATTDDDDSNNNNNNNNIVNCDTVDNPHASATESRREAGEQQLASSCELGERQTTQQPAKCQLGLARSSLRARAPFYM